MLCLAARNQDLVPELQHAPYTARKSVETRGYGLPRVAASVSKITGDPRAAVATGVAELARPVVWKTTALLAVVFFCLGGLPAFAQTNVQQR